LNQPQRPASCRCPAADPTAPGTCMRPDNPRTLAPGKRLGPASTRTLVPGERMSPTLPRPCPEREPSAPARPGASGVYDPAMAEGRRVGDDTVSWQVTKL